MNGRWTEGERIKELDNSYREPPARQDQSFDPDVLFADFPTVQDTNVTSGPSQQNQDILSEEELQSLSRLLELKDIVSLQGIQHIAPLQDGQSAPPLAAVPELSPLPPHEELSRFIYGEKEPTAHLDHVRNPTTLPQDLRPPQSPLESLYGPTSSEFSNLLVREKPDDSNLSQNYDLQEPDILSNAPNSVSTSQIVQSEGQELSEAAFRQQQSNSSDPQRFDNTKGKNISDDLDSLFRHLGSNRDHVSTLETLPPQESEFEAGKEVHDQELAPDIRLSADETQSMLNGRSPRENQTPSSRHSEDTESEGSLELRLSLSDEETESNATEWLEKESGYQPLGQSRSREEWNRSNSSTGGRTRTKARSEQDALPFLNTVGDLHANQLPSSSDVRQYPGATLAEAIEATRHARAKAVTFVTPVKLPTERKKKPMPERRATPRVKMISRNGDIRDRRALAEEEAARANLDDQRGREEDESFEHMTFDFVNSLSFHYTPLPDIEHELNKSGAEPHSIPTISLEVRREHLRSSSIRAMRCNPKCSKSFDAATGHELLVVPDEEMFRVLYRLVRKIVLHRFEGDIASFVSHILKKSTSKKIPGYFCKKFILFVENLHTPDMLPKFHNFMFDKVDDEDITRTQREIELHFKNKLSSLKPESMTAAFVRKWERHSQSLEFVKEAKRELLCRAKEYRRKRKFLSQHGVNFKPQVVPKYEPEVVKKKSELRMVTEQFAHEFAWYSREIFLHDHIQSHYLLARFVMSNIHDRKAEEILKSKVGRIGDVERADFFVDMEKYVSAVWPKIIKVLRDFLTFADPAGLMEVLCAELDPRCNAILMEVNGEINPLERQAISHAVLIPRLGNRIGSFSAKAFGKANDKIDFRKKVLVIRGKNVDAVCELHERISQELKNSPDGRP
ncbi:hypothetical protein FGB62_130g140 [Gracilaria domingensis]|nr:hypothetical protein FGB62_130g140 [Gracilaria domingensis]